MSAITHDHGALARGLATGLGWFSIALGVGEILGARQLRRSVGAWVPSAVFSAYGLREIATGVAILSSPGPNQMVWARVLSDILDLATLAPTLDPANRHRGAAQGAKSPGRNRCLRQSCRAHDPSHAPLGQFPSNPRQAAGFCAAMC